MNERLASKKHLFEGIDKFGFDIFDFTKQVGRDMTLPYMIVGMMHNSQIDCDELMINEEKLVMFLNAITRGYRKDV